MASEFEGRHVVVTGAAGALGSGVARLLLQRGATCHLPVRGELPPDSVPAGRVRVHTGVDLGDEAQVRRFYGAIPAPWASIHCVGGFAMRPFAETTLGEFENLLRLNAATAFLCCREAVRAMRGGGGGGRIVNVVARPAIEPRAGGGMVAYTASKAAVAALTVALAEELAPEEIRVNAVAPSILDTPQNRGAMPDADHASWPSVDDVAAAVAFLVSPDAAGPRGALVPVYGGA